MTWDAFSAAMHDGLETFFSWTAPFVFTYFLLINTSYLALVVLSWFAFRREMDRRETRREQALGDLAPGISVIVPAFNEEALIVSSVRAMLSLRYAHHEVVVVDDGSTDGTLRLLSEAFDLVPVPGHPVGDLPVRGTVTQVLVPRNGRTRLLVVSKTNSGRSDAVNVGINAAREPIIVFTDADSILEADALARVAQPFIDDPNRVVAVGGTVRAVNGSTVVAGRLGSLRMPTGWLARAQVVEYLRSFLIGRTGWAAVGTLILISGAFGAYRRDVVIEAGGLDTDSIGEDFELCLRVHRMMRDQKRDYRVVFVPEPVCWTEVPSTRAVLQRQRSRWHRGLWETLWAYRGMLFRPRYGRVAWLGLPYYWVFELVAPLIEFAGLVLVPLGLAFGAVNVEYALLLLLVAYGYATFVTLAALAVEEWAFHRYERWRDIGVAAASAVFENIGYRQQTVWWRLEGWYSSLRGRQQVWGVMTRAGFEGESA